MSFRTEIKKTWDTIICLEIPILAGSSHYWGITIICNFSVIRTKVDLIKLIHNWFSWKLCNEILFHFIMVNREKTYRPLLRILMSGRRKKILINTGIFYPKKIYFFNTIRAILSLNALIIVSFHIVFELSYIFFKKHIEVKWVRYVLKASQFYLYCAYCEHHFRHNFISTIVQKIGNNYFEVLWSKN